MGLKTGILLLVAAAFFSGCGPSPSEKTIHLACQALKAQDWEAYSRLTITEADFMMVENNISESEADQSFAGSSLRPKQRQHLREQYEQAIQGCDGCLDFSRCLYVFPTLSATSTITTLGGDDVILEEYILTIEMDGPETSAPGLGPYFILVPWEDEVRILSLRFPRRN